MIFPWQSTQWQQLWEARKANRLPHALLFTGLSGTGKTEFANEFVQALLCEKYATLQSIDALPISACGACHACRVMANRSHLSVRWIEPEKEGHAIKVDQVREICDFTNQTTIQGEYRVVIIRPADNMNASAANALLKTLEEPSQGALLILIANQKGRLPATILSRCQHILFSCPDKNIAYKWLKESLAQREDKFSDPDLLLRLAHGAPLAALKLAEENVLLDREKLLQTLCALNSKQADPLKSAEKMQDMDTLRLLDIMLSWVRDLLLLQIGGEHDQLTNRDYAQQLEAQRHQRSAQKITRLMSLLQQCRAQIALGLNLNKTLMVENLMLRWME